MLVLGVLLVGGPVAAAERHEVRWKIAATGVWPPAISGGKLLLKSGNWLALHSMARGQQLWKVELPRLRYGSGILAASERYIYVLDRAGVLLLDPRTGKQIKHKKIPGANSVLALDSTVYVTGSKGTYRFDATLTRRLGRAAKFKGELRGADGQYVVIYCHEPGPRTRGSPNRLKVVDLARGKQAYQFKLLPGGGHRVIKLGNGRVVFIDYTKRVGGKNSTKLYYTEADYIKSRKLKDISLSDSYSSPESDTFWVAGDPAGQLFFTNHGETAGGPSALMAYDPAQAKTLWSRVGLISSMGLLLHRGKLWTGLVAKDGKARAVAYSPDDGNPLLSLPLDSPGTGAPVAVGQVVLLRTRDSIYCLAPAAPEPTPASQPAKHRQPAVSATTGGGQGLIPGWQMMRHRPTGFLVQLPPNWHLDRRNKRKLGGKRYVIPFARKQKLGRKKIYLGSVTVLTWEAAGRNVDGLWQSVYVQRRGISPNVRVSKVRRVRDVGGSGVPGIRATYSFRDGRGYTVKLRSLCVVHHGVAFELRAWAGPNRPGQIWRQVKRIFKTFKPQRF